MGILGSRGRKDVENSSVHLSEVGSDIYLSCLNRVSLLPSKKAVKPNLFSVGASLNMKKAFMTKRQASKQKPC
jgi:hypothetical protein